MAYLINDNKVVGITNSVVKSGTLVKYSESTVAENIDANRDFNLVNARTARISNAKKWERSLSAVHAPHAVEINENEFSI